MRIEIEAVLTSQGEYAAANTPAMEARGIAIRQIIPRQLADALSDSLQMLPADLSDLQIKGSDGAGQKSEVPWIRLFSKARSPKATDGWYLVYLFDAFGQKVFLSLNQGTNTWSKGALVRRPESDIVERSNWARQILKPELGNRSGLVESITLPTRGSTLAGGYELGNVYALEYLAGEVPPEDLLQTDFVYMANLLVSLYELLDNSLHVPGDPPPEIIDAEIMLNEVAGKPRGGGRYRLTASERKAIEKRAVAVAVEYLIADGFSVTDVGDIESYDLDARRGSDHLFVEVKGTVGSGDQVILTRNEVALHRREYPNNMLVVVSGIRLDYSGPLTTAHGGTPHVKVPWQIADVDLVPIAFEYDVSIG